MPPHSGGIFVFMNKIIYTYPIWTKTDADYSKKYLLPLSIWRFLPVWEPEHIF
jgi:hypothetical protein